MKRLLYIFLLITIGCSTSVIVINRSRKVNVQDSGVLLDSLAVDGSTKINPKKIKNGNN